MNVFEGLLPSSSAFSIRLGVLLYLFGFGFFGCTPSNSPPEVEKPEVELPVPTLVEVLPREDEKSLKRDTEITLRFSLPLDPLTLTVNQEDNQCTGTVQLSADDFKTCVRLKKPLVGSDRTEYVIAPKGIYKSGRRYRLRFSEGIQTPEGGRLPQTVNSRDFRTYSSQQLGSPGNDRGMAIAVDDKGQAYVTGITAKGDNTEQNDVFLVKFSTDGRQLWIRQAGFEYRPESCRLSLLSGGQVRISAQHPGVESSRMLVVDFDEEGGKLWNRVYDFPGSSFGSAIAVDDDLSLMGSGSRSDPLVRIQADGTLAWTAKVKGKVRFEDIVLTEKLLLYAAGSLEGEFDGHSKLGKKDAFLLKMHQSGIKRWSRQFGTEDNDQVVKLLVGKSGIIAVTKTQYASIPEPLFHAILYRFDSEGEQLWEKSLKTILPGPVLAAEEIEDEHLLLAGYGINTDKTEKDASSGVKDEDAFAARLDSQGNLVWLETFGGKGDDRALAISPTPSGNTFVTGYTTGSIDGSINEGKEDVFLVRINSDGKRF